MGVIINFDFGGFARAFPQLAVVGQPLAQQYFTIATTMHRNDGGGPISDANLQATLLNMLVAHLIQLYAPRDANGNPASTGTPAPVLAGRISSASEGSVSVSTEALQGFNTAQAAWLSQTSYGAMYWAATSQFRTMRYRPFCDPRQAVR